MGAGASAGASGKYAASTAGMLPSEKIAAEAAAAANAAAAARAALAPKKQGRIKKRLAKLADPELSSSEDEEELSNCVLYVHDSRIPVGAQAFVEWLDCQQVEFQLSTIERHAAHKDSMVRIERVLLDGTQLPLWYAELEDAAFAAGTHREGKHVHDIAAQQTRAPPRSLPLLKRGKSLYRGQLAISDFLATLYPTVEMEQDLGVNHGFVQRFKDFMALTIDLIQARCETKVQPPSWGGPQMDLIREGRGTDLRRVNDLMHSFQQELQYIEGKLRFGDGPYLDGKVLHLGDWALGPRLQTALLGLRHFLGWDLAVPPFAAINRYRASLIRNPAFPRLLFLNPKLMVAFHQKTRDDLVRKQTRDSLRASGKIQRIADCI